MVQKARLNAVEYSSVVVEYYSFNRKNRDRPGGHWSIFSNTNGRRFMSRMESKQERVKGKQMIQEQLLDYEDHLEDLHIQEIEDAELERIYDEYLWELEKMENELEKRHYYDLFVQDMWEEDHDYSQYMDELYHY